MNVNGVRAHHGTAQKGMTDSPKGSGLGALDELFASLLEGAGLMTDSEKLSGIGWESSLSSPDTTDSSLTAEQQGFWFSTLGLMTLSQELALKNDSSGAAAVTENQTDASQSLNQAAPGALASLPPFGGDQSQALYAAWMSNHLATSPQPETTAAEQASENCHTCGANGAGQGSTGDGLQLAAIQDQHVQPGRISTPASSPVLTDKSTFPDTIAQASPSDKADRTGVNGDSVDSSELASALRELEASQTELSADEQLWLSRAHQQDQYSANRSRSPLEVGAALAETRNATANRDDSSARTIGNDSLAVATVDAANSKANGDSGSRHDERAERDHGKSRESLFSLSQSSLSDKELDLASAAMGSEFQTAQDRIGGGGVGQEIGGAQSIHLAVSSGRRGVAGADLSHAKTNGDGAIPPGGELTPSAEGLVPENQVTAANSTAELFESRPLLNSVAAQIATVVDGATEWLNIEIHPQELGQIEIRVAQIDDRLVAQIVASNEQTGAWLDRERQALQDYLAQHGMELDQVDVFQKQADSSQDRETASDWQESFPRGEYAVAEGLRKTTVSEASFTVQSAPLGNSGVNILV